MKTDRPSHLSAGVVVVRHTDSGWRFLMLRAYRNWDFPKGSVESGEDPLHAARREVTEETLIRDLQFLWANPCGNRALQPQQGGAVLPGRDQERGGHLAGAA